MNRLIVLIYGDPLQGKSYLAEKLNKFYDNSNWIFTDQTTEEFFLSRYHDLWTNNIQKMFSDGLSDNVIAEFKEHLFKMINETDNCVVIAEGYVLKYFKFPFKNVIRIEAKEYKYIIEKKTYHISQVFAVIRNIILDRLLIKYQSFEDLYNHGGSYSLEKFKRLNIENLTNKTVLDVGCNNGYFCFKAVNHRRWQNANKAIGIDIIQDSIDIAETLRDCIYQHKNIDFECVDFFHYIPKEPINVILCLSTFHYFREKQQEFLHKCYSILSDGGLLILEAGISMEYQGQTYTEKYKRGVDSEPCYFPNEHTLIEMASDLFTLVFECESVMQAGDEKLRKVYHFAKRT